MATKLQRETVMTHVFFFACQMSVIDINMLCSVSVNYCLARKGETHIYR